MTHNSIQEKHTQGRNNDKNKNEYHWKQNNLPNRCLAERLQASREPKIKSLQFIPHIPILSHIYSQVNYQALVRQDCNTK